MRIAQIAPLFESVPPKLYGGTERVVSWLTEELVRQGHDVTLFASGDSVTSGRLVPMCPRALWGDPRCREPLPHHVREVSRAVLSADAFDVLHFHTDFVQFPLIRASGCPAITTLHGQLSAFDHGALFAEYDDVGLVSISDSQRRPVPDANWLATVHHGMPLDLHRYRPLGGDYLAFLGRASPEKGLDRAIEIACRLKMKLKVAVRICDDERAYYSEVIAPLVKKAGRWVEMIGEVGGAEKDRFLGEARAMLFPIDWQEPFGLVMIEAMACGTPVIAYRNGSVEEVIDHGATGFVVGSIEEAVAATRAASGLDRALCRSTFERRFGVARMARDYLEVYRAVAAARPRSSGVHLATARSPEPPRQGRGLVHSS